MTAGNCMEIVVGISYASFTHGTRLPDKGKLHFASPAACADWAGLWPMFQGLGVKAIQQAPAPPPLPEAAPAWPRAAPASAASTLQRLTQATQDPAAVPPPLPDNLRESLATALDTLRSMLHHPPGIRRSPRDRSRRR